MIKIYKYPLELKDLNEIDMPEQAEILSVQIQNGIPCLWAKVNTDYPEEKRAIRIIGTGNSINPCEPLVFITTYQFEGLVFHVFEIPNEYKKL